MKKNCIKKNKKGFTLVELIIVIAILAILVGLLTVNVIRYIEKSRVAKDKVTIDNAYTSIITALADEKGYDNFLECQSGTAGGDEWVQILDSSTGVTTDALDFNQLLSVSDAVRNQYKFYDEVIKTFGSQSIVFNSKKYAGQILYFTFNVDDTTKSIGVNIMLHDNDTGEDYTYQR